MAESTTTTTAAADPRLPRVTIQFCTQCKWMLRAAYFAQELLSTFSTALGEVALQPATGGVFVVEITTTASSTAAAAAGGDDDATAPTAAAAAAAAAVAAGGGGETQTRTVRLWDRKVDGGFPETKELKRRVRDVVAPGRDLGHVDRTYPRGGQDKHGGGGQGEGEEGGGEGKKDGEGEGERKGAGVTTEGGEVAAAKVCKVGEKERCEDCE